MKEQKYHHPLKHMIHLLHLLQANHIEVEPLLTGDKQTDLLSPKEIQFLQTVCSLMDEMSAGLLICQADGSQEILYANHRFLRIAQCETIKDLRTFTDNSFQHVVYSRDLNTASDRILPQTSEEQAEPDPAEYRIRSKDGSIRWVEDYSRLFHCEENGDVICSFVEDVTDKRVQQKKQLNDALDRANMAAIARNAFLTNISYDIRTPLNAILGFISQAKESLYDTAAQQDYLNRIENASQKLLDMLNKVLEVTALSTSDELIEEKCDLCTIGQEVYDFLHPHAEEKNITYTLDCGDVEHGNIYADRQKLKQMMLNLVNNAITYTEPGGTVSLTITEDDEASDLEAVYHIQVKDTGIGISEDFLKHIFEPFSREKNSTFSEIHSFGLGLTIVKGIVDKMGGTIEAKSAENQGSTFTVTLRLRRQTASDAETWKTTPVPPKRTILLVEDNEINREIEAELLERLNFIIDPAENGEVALQKITQASPGTYDLVLLDLRMPVMDGWQTATAIRHLPDPVLANIPIIALSSSIFLADYQKAKECEMNAHLAKPLNLPVLLETIDELLGK